MSDIPPSKPWSVEQFDIYRSHLVRFVNREVVPLIRDTTCRRIVIRAPVKSGKREMVEYIATRDLQPKNKTRVHAFISNWHRTADEDQRQELRDFNLEVFAITSKSAADHALRWVKEQQQKGKWVVLHLDECDHGTGHRQILAKLWNALHDTSRITFILYSATPEEVIYSAEVDEATEFMNEMMHGTLVRYTPPDGYCGPGRFLDDDLVTEARPFFSNPDGIYRISAQGGEIINGVRAEIDHSTARNIVVLRLSYNFNCRGKPRKDDKAIYRFAQNLASFPELRDFLIIFDDNNTKFPRLSGNASSEKIQWSNSAYWRGKARDIPILIIIDQTSSRSTEWACHDRIFATHDYRNSSDFSILSQAQERVNHYEQKYGGFQPIRVYGSVKTFQLSAGRIDYKEYLSCPWTKRKVDRRTAGDQTLYRIRNEASGEERVFPNEDACDNALIELGCYAELGISQRVRGTVKDERVIGCEFFACTKDNFNQVQFPSALVGSHQFENPFRDDKMQNDRYLGYLRGYHLFNFEDVAHQPGWGFGKVDPQIPIAKPRLTVCYRNGQSGVALRYDTGEVRRADTLTSYKSMYEPRRA
jgi:hypothetical protein